MTTDYYYEPPEREFTDTLLAFRDFELAAAWHVRVESDPLGPVNKIVSLRKGDRTIKTVLRPVPAGVTPSVGYDEGRADIRFWDAQWNDLGGQTGREPSWFVEVDGRRVIDVPVSEIRPPATPQPATPLPQRIRRAFSAQHLAAGKRWLRAGVDSVAKRLGYHRVDDCGWWDE